MKLLDNVTNLVRDDMAVAMSPGCCVSVSAAEFSMYAYEALKKELEGVKEFRFIYSTPTFVKRHAEKQRREWYMPHPGRERSLYGTEFELRLRNELKQKAVARECADWIKRKAKFKSNISGSLMPGFAVIEGCTEGMVNYLPFNGFTTSELGCGNRNSLCSIVQRTEGAMAAPFAQQFAQLWNDRDLLEDVTQQVLDGMLTAYRENPPELIYYLTLHHVFGQFLEGLSEDVLPNEATGFKKSAVWGMLYDFQRDAALGIIHKLEQFNGCILADSVGLGKTFTALAVIKYYENRNKNVLVLCPKKLSDNWNTYKGNYRNNPLAADRLRYDVLYHTDLSRRKGLSNGLDLERLNWSNYDLVVIDESHNFRNGSIDSSKSLENRYDRLMAEVIRQGVKTRVLMLSATPVNNRFADLRNQLALAYEGEAAQFDEKLDTRSGVEHIFRQAQAAFTAWSHLPAEERTAASLQKALPFDFFKVLDSVTIARSRKHIKQFYAGSGVGNFPERLKPLALSPGLSLDINALSFKEIVEDYLTLLTLDVYVPTKYIHPSKREKYEQGGKGNGLSQAGREMGVRHLMCINLLKRLESSVHAFRLTLQRVQGYIHEVLKTLDNFDKARRNPYLPQGDAYMSGFLVAEDELDLEDRESEEYLTGRKIQVDLRDMDVLSWRRALLGDAAILNELCARMASITPEQDAKLQELLMTLADKVCNPINGGNKKALIFTAFSDTAEYLYKHVSAVMKKRFGLESALVTGAVNGRSTLGDKGGAGALNRTLTLFSPLSKGRDVLYPGSTEEIDILIATDCVSEGQNLQDCDYQINYDIHWNPVRLIQRYGRVDRIGSKNDRIQMVNFWPDVELDEYIKLKGRVESRMQATVLTATGNDNPLSDDEELDLEYRAKQLKRLKQEVVDMEDMSESVSIMDLGLNEYRLDLLEWKKRNKHLDPDKLPDGLHAVVPEGEGLPAGAFFVLRRGEKDGASADGANLLYPWYMVYVNRAGECVCAHTDPARLLDALSKLCRSYSEPLKDLCARFNERTEDGRNMAEYSRLLDAAVASIIGEKEEEFMESLFTSAGVSMNKDSLTGIEDFELLCFIAIEEGGAR